MDAPVAKRAMPGVAAQDTPPAHRDGARRRGRRTADRAQRMLCQRYTEGFRAYC